MLLLIFIKEFIEYFYLTLDDNNKNKTMMLSPGASESGIQFE